MDGSHSLYITLVSVHMQLEPIIEKAYIYIQSMPCSVKSNQMPPIQIKDSTKCCEFDHSGLSWTLMFFHRRHDTAAFFLAIVMKLETRGDSVGMNGNSPSFLSLCTSFFSSLFFQAQAGVGGGWVKESRKLGNCHCP